MCPSSVSYLKSIEDYKEASVTYNHIILTLFLASTVWTVFELHFLSSPLEVSYCSMFWHPTSWLLQVHYLVNPLYLTFVLSYNSYSKCSFCRSLIAKGITDLGGEGHSLPRQVYQHISLNGQLHYPWYQPRVAMMVLVHAIILSHRSQKCGRKLSHHISILMYGHSRGVLSLCSHPVSSTAMFKTNVVVNAIHKEQDSPHL